MKTWDEMEPRERDAWVAEHVMGLLRVKMSRAWRDPETGSEHIHVEDEDDRTTMTFFGNDACPSHIPEAYMPHGDNQDAYREPVPNYTTDASSDYEVLKRVRETCKSRGGFRVDYFIDALEEIWGMTNWGEANPIAYQPGDYSHAAYLALTGVTQCKTN